MKKVVFSLSLLMAFAISAQIPCENGSANGYDCYGIDLMAIVDVLSLGAEEYINPNGTGSGVWVNDIWGWTDQQTGKEYALVGMTNGTSFVDISDPINPVVLGVLREHNWNFKTEKKVSNQSLLHDGAKSVWRDIKTYRNYAYIVSEDSNHGIQVFDLTDLRDVSNPSASNFFEEAGHYDGIGQAHNVFINEETGFLYAVGFRQAGAQWTCNDGGLHIVNLADPANPVYAGCYDTDGYTHDTQCVIYQGPDSQYFGQEICFSSNEDTITLTDVTDKENPIRIKKFSYSGVQYVHQGWLTEDHKYFISNDELDEYYNGHNTKTYVWDVQNLDEPQLIGTFDHGTGSIDHNLYNKGNRVFMANYSSGLRILNMYGVEEGELELDLFFDTYKSNNSANFWGAWSNYPYFESGLVIVSDITNGLFILDPVALIIEEQQSEIVACEGQHLNFPFKVNGDEIEFQWQVDEGNGFENITDFERYHSTTKMILHAHTLSGVQSGNKYRCLMTDRDGDDYISEVMTLTVIDTAEVDMSFEQGLEYEVSFTNNSLNADSYTWDFGDGINSTDEDPVHVFDGPGTYTVQLVAEDQCGTREKSFEVELAQCNEVIADFSNAADAYSVNFSNNSVGSNSYLWDFGDGIGTSSDENPTYTYSQLGNYDVQLISHDGCDADTLTQRIQLMPLNTHIAPSLTIHPNPSNGIIALGFGQGFSGEVQLMGLNGAILKRANVAGELELTFGALRPGMYLVKAISAQGSVTHKIVVK